MLEQSCEAVDHDFRRFFCVGCGHIVDVPVHCGNRFCEICMKSRQWKARQKIRVLVDSLQLEKGFRLKMLTLSVPNTDDLAAGVDHLIASFRRLRQRSYWKNRIKGGLAVVEISGRSGNWHPHLHILIESKFLKYAKIHKDWCDVSGGIGVYISDVNSKKVVNYITKYMTKTETSGDDTINASRALKGKRLFQPFGTWHKKCNDIPKIEYACPKCGLNNLVWDRILFSDALTVSNEFAQKKLRERLTSETIHT